MNTSLLKKFAVAALLAGTFFTARAALKIGDTLPDLASFKLEGKLPDSRKAKWCSWIFGPRGACPARNRFRQWTSSKKNMATGS